MMPSTSRLTKRHLVAIFVLVAILVIGIIATLTLLGFGVGKQALVNSWKLKARNAATSLTIGIEGYNDEYGHLPRASSPDPAQTDGGGFMDILLGWNLTENPKAIIYFHAAPASHGGGLVFPTGHPPTGVKLLDPWGNPYFIALDSDYDLRITDPFDPTRVISGRSALAWSTGPDGKHDLTTPKAKVNRDNVYSWK